MAHGHSIQRLVVLICLVAGLTVSARPPRPFVIVAEPLPPYEYPAADGQPAGINAEIIDRVMRELDVPYEIRFYPWARAWLMIKNGAADAVLSVSYQQDREPFLSFTAEQSEFWDTGVVPPDFLWLPEYVFFVHRRLADSVRFESYAKLKQDELRIVINDQYSYDDAFLQSGLTMKARSSPESALRVLLDGEADLYPLDRTAGWALLRRQGVDEQVTWLPRPLFMKPYLLGFARRSDYPELERLRDRFHARVRAMRHDGTIESITARHLDPIRPARSDRPIRFVCEDWPPFEFRDRDRIGGLNAELLDRVMTTLRIPYEIRSYPWTRAWMMAERGHAEAILSVSYNPGREDVLFYTDCQREAARTGALPHHYLWISRYVFFVKNRNLERFRFDSYDTIIDAGWRVGLNKGYSYDPSFPVDRFTSRTYFDTAAGFMGLIADEVDLYPMDLTVGRYTLREMGMEDSVTFLSPDLFSKAYLAPFTRTSDYPDLEHVMYEFNHQIRQLRAAGVIPR